LERLDLRLEDKEEIVRRVTPLLDTILLQNLERKESQTVEILAEHLAGIIEEASRTRLPQLSDALQKVIAPAISKEIANNQDVMIDALYPIMGGMISKYVTQAIKELMEHINRKIEQGFSVERFKRKIKAKLSGVSETELLLEESSDAIISALFIIHKETGLLISSASLEDHEIDDPYMVASMASAIKDFITDWINQHQENKEEIQILSYGNATLYIESAGSVYVIAFLDSEPDYELRSDINAFFASVVKEYAKYFQHFDGDDSTPEVKELSQKLKAYLLAQKNLDEPSPGKQKINPAKVILLLLAAILLGYGVYWGYKEYILYTLEKQIAQASAQEVNLEEQEGKVVMEGYVKSLTHVPAMIELVEKRTGKKVVNHLHFSVSTMEQLLKARDAEIHAYDEKLSVMQKDLAQISKPALQKIVLLKNRVDLLNGKIDALRKKEQEIHHALHIKEEIAATLFETFRDSPYYHPDTQSLDFAPLHLFPASKARYREPAMQTLSQTVKTYLEVLSPYRAYLEKIVIEGHSDSSGEKEKNMRITQERADAVKAYLLKQPYMQQHGFADIVVAVGKGSSEAIFTDGREDKNASRRVTIHFELDPDTIYETVQKALQE